MPKNVDVAIIGGGLIGCSIAYFLGRRGVKSLVIERNHVGSEASGANAGALWPQGEAKGPGPFIWLALASNKMFPNLSDELAEDIHYRRSGMMHVILDDEDVAKANETVAWQSVLGLHQQRLTGDEAWRLEPALSPKVMGALYYENEGHLDPLRLVNAYSKAARRLGAEVWTGTLVTGLEAKGGRVTSVATAKGPVQAGTVVNAAGPWSCEIAHYLGLNAPVVPLRGQIVTTQALPPIFEMCIVSKRGYFVPKVAGNVIIGSTREFVGYKRAVTWQAIQNLARGASEVIPAMGDTLSVRTWAALRPYTEDEIPILGHAPGYDNFVIASGHFRNGCLLSPITGKLIAELIVDGKPSTSLEPFSPSRFRQN